MIAAHFDKFGAPLSLIKSISAFFELACAATAAEMVWHVTRSRWRGVFAFSSVWLAPTVVLNGGVWGQADSIWAFFTLVSVSLFMRGRNGTLPFAMAVAVKAQGIFLGPFVLGIMLRRRLPLAWLLAIPLVYPGSAIPVLLAGRPIASVLKVYLAQAGTFHSLTMNAANIWVFCGDLPYAAGVSAGLVLAGSAGFALAVFVGRTRRDGPEFILLAACTSLFLMPYLLPKMHDRYFYAFEIATIALACLDTRHLPLAIIAQIDGVLAYLGFDPGIVLGIMPAAICNSLIGGALVLGPRGDACPAHVRTETWLAFSGASAALMIVLVVDAGKSLFLYVAVSALFTLTAALLLWEALRQTIALSDARPPAGA